MIRLAPLVALSVWVAGCVDTRPQNPTTPNAPAQLVAMAATTAGAIHISNLERHVEFFTDKCDSGRCPVDEAILLAEALHQQWLILGDIAAAGRALRVADSVVQRNPSAPIGYLLRARLRMSLHRFAAALPDVNAARHAARERGADVSETDAMEAEIRWNLGHPDAADPGPVQADADSRMAALYHRASVAHRRGQHDEARALLTRAAAEQRTSNPLPAVALLLLLADIEEAAGHADASLRYLEEAVRRLPQHLGATEALSARLLRDGESARAIALMVDASRVSSDPHVRAQLALASRQRGDLDAAKRYTDEAVRGFHTLLQQYPNTYAAEAAEFLSQVPGRQREARQWAEVATRARAVPASWLLLAHIERQLGHQQAARAAAHKALSSGRATPAQARQARAIIDAPENNQP